ncbi:Coenzyme A disulfide reductase [Clostridiales bacterium CHKCI001]|nr:Coenzyme A disulfide reductase [Clostridiales bacterium CHKCI001]
MSKTVIIGGVAGGATAAARLRRLDEKMKIVLLERGDYISYANCGLPYYIGDVIKNRDALLLQTPQGMKDKFYIDVRVQSEVTQIHKEKKLVTVKEKNGNVYEESYDNLIIATGSSPLKPPIPGIESEGIYTLWNVNDTDKIRGIIDEKQPKTVAIIGGGFIGLEMAENLHKRGIQVFLIEAQNQVMAPLDFEMAQILHENINENGVSLYLGDGVTSFEKAGEKVIVTLASQKTIKVDFVVLSIGVRPNSQLAKDAGLELNQRGGIKVDSSLQTSYPGIWAVGDVIEVEHFVTGKSTMIPLAGPANKQGRIVANNICGLTQEKEEYEGSLGTSVAQVFDLTVASTGLNEKQLKAEGFEKGTDYETIVISQKSHASYYPMAMPLTLKLIFTNKGKILGTQIVGQDGVDKRIDTIATTMRVGGTIETLKKLELAYAPPYSSAKDPVNMAGFVADNSLKGLVSLIMPNEITKDMILLDVRENMERLAWHIPGSIHIPLGEIRKRIEELPKDKIIVTYCAVGVRSYNAARILMQNGWNQVKVLAGGTNFYKSFFFQPEEIEQSEEINEQSSQLKETKAKLAVKTLDCCGLQCPGPIMKVNATMNTMQQGEILKISATDMGFAADIKSWCQRTGNTFIEKEKTGKEVIVTIQKGEKQEKNGTTKPEISQGKTLVVFDGDLDKVLASFIIANGAAAMGRPVTMFFTFWGLNVLRKPKSIKINKTMLDKVFAKMMPRGAKKLKLSKMHLFGIGTAMIKSVMKKKRVFSLEELITQAKENGVRLVACTMSMDIMGIRPEELIDGVELGGVASYLADAEKSDVNLFI